MVLYVQKWDILPDKREAYLAWSQEVLKQLLAVPGVMEFCAYRVIAGSSQIVVNYKFKNLDSFAAWRNSEIVQKMTVDLYNYATNITSEVWGPSPLYPEPIRV